MRTSKVQVNVCILLEAIEATWWRHVENQGTLFLSFAGCSSTQVSLQMVFSWATHFAQSVSCKLLGESLPPYAVNLSLIGRTRKCFPARKTRRFIMPTLTTCEF